MNKRTLVIASVLMLVASLTIIPNATDIFDWERAPSPPQEYVGEASQAEVADVLDRIFPLATSTRLVKGSSFQLVSAEEMRRFLDEEKRLNMNITPRTGSMLATRLRGQMVTPGWARTPFGVAYAPNSAANVFITREEDALVIYLIDPKTGEMHRTTTPQHEVRWVDLE